MENQLQEKYNSLWGKYTKSTFSAVLERGHAFHFDDDEQHSDILFVGINPSFTEGSESENYTFNREATTPYFEPFRKIKDELESQRYEIKHVKWTHLDILVFRETSQKFIHSLMNDLHGASFIFEQVQIAKERIAHIQPKVIVVCNTMAKELMGKNRTKLENGVELGVWMGYEFEFNMEYGSYTITNSPELAHTHVLFSSMLSGQRALDLGSRERLVWQAARILKKD